MTNPRKGANSSYWGGIKEAISTSIEGVKLTLDHFNKAISKERRQPIGTSHEDYFTKYQEGIVTMEYPREKFPVPDVGRYKLHNEIDDCIVCDKCVKVCPVNCIDIEPVKSAEVIGTTSDGTPKRIYAAKFDIDMAKCCFCGLCTTVCPTECLTMTKDYEFSEYDLFKLNYQFSEMTPEEVEEKKRLFEEAQAAKKQAAAKNTEAKPESTGTAKPKFRPSFKPKV
ncbi:4Fe-4S dicluster domain-containing protein [Limibacter armeniacum]|uniref:4Fe-4S dicluster domain-containing protein n=1 Tax=Limibacter armeniacum TaxID=466084 RepID=UPI002FE66661